jgi:hypothetical protein
VTEEIGGEYVRGVQRVLGEHREVPTVARDAVEAYDAREARVAPAIQGKCRIAFGRLRHATHSHVAEGASLLGHESAEG